MVAPTSRPDNLENTARQVYFHNSALLEMLIFHLFFLRGAPITLSYANITFSILRD